MDIKIKDAFKWYLYGYLNEYQVYNFWLNSKYTNYKKSKIKRTANYLKIPDNYYSIFSKFIIFISNFETLISITIIVFRVLKYLTICAFTKKNKLENSVMALGIDPSEVFLKGLLDSADLIENNTTIIKIPSIKTSFDGFEQITIFKGLSIFDILKAFHLSMKIIFTQKRKYGNRDLLFRSHSSLEYFMTYFFINNSSVTNRYIFNNTYDRWAFIFGNIPHDTTFIQHGVLSKEIPLIKIGNINKAYYINKEQKNICENFLFKNVPSYHYRKLMKNNSEHKLKKNGLKNVLLICNLIFLEKEKDIICELSKKHINLYVKPHPLDDISVYKELQVRNDFVLLEKTDFPKMDMVISYYSTLADEYESTGAIVLRYNDDSFKDKYSKQFLK